MLAGSNTGPLPGIPLARPVDFRCLSTGLAVSFIGDCCLFVCLRDRSSNSHLVAMWEKSGSILTAVTLGYGRIFGLGLKPIILDDMPDGVNLVVIRSHANMLAD